VSYADSGDDRYVQIKLVVIRNWLDQLARLRDENNLNRVLWVQMSGEYQRLRAQSKLEPSGTQATKERVHGTSPASLPADQHVR
jgi:hypothetical protein